MLNRLNGLQGGAEVERRLAACRAKLFARRAGRVRPGLDDKVLADWNGLLIGALARASAIFDEPGWLALASGAFDFIATQMSEGPRLRHAWREGSAGAQAFALDYAAMIRAALALHEATQEARYVDQAKSWAGALIAFHTDAATGMLYTAAADATGVPLRLAPASDEAVPNAHGPWLHALTQLGLLTGDTAWQARADALFSQLAADALGQGLSHCSILNAFDFRQRNVHVAIAEADGALLTEALRHELLNRVVERVRPGEAASAAPAVAALAKLHMPAAVVCRNQACSAPMRNPAELRGFFLLK